MSLPTTDDQTGVDRPVVAVLVAIAALFGAAMGIGITYLVGVSNALIGAPMLGIIATLLMVGAYARWGWTS